MIKFINILMLMICSLLLSACGPDTRPVECRKLLGKWWLVIERMEKSGRFSNDFIRQHRIQHTMVNLLSERSKETTEEQRTENCLKYAAIIEPQIKLSRIIGELSQNHLEERFPPPLGAGIGARRK
ncbi:hypothetical protein AXE65_05990 [Ventosimonas gracilis]|uniref:Lipoprotein n=1 Tax=Ventosimonas gracilis TaxID=1680762 RepID=A0A139SMB5_9GAMM|nr:hypothetical protein [Ventosimonas gracilis]KXU35726.1 hypothetical protein AXE65_05990 [Ventosimonas gracilis]